MPLANNAYRVKISSTGGIFRVISDVKVGSLIAAVSGELSATPNYFVINASTSGYANVPPKILFTLSGNPIMQLQHQSTPTLTVSGAIHSAGGQAGYWIEAGGLDLIGITNDPVDTNYITSYKVDGGIATDVYSFSIHTITAGLSGLATSNYWARTGTTLTTLTAYDHVTLDGDFVLRSAGATSAKYDVALNKTTFYGVGTVPIVDIAPDSSYERLSITGDVYCRGNLNVDGSKNFKIPHPNPKKKDFWLFHSSLEGPEIGVYWRDQFTMTGQNHITIFPDYWQYLVEQNTVQVICDSPEYLEREISSTSIKFNKRTNNYYNCPVSVFVVAQRKINDEKDIFKIESPME